ncbi:hypothetical protein IU485_27580 [Nocardia cyriacigeorgica]|uniref:hypothetical protein n=1 Tax=Nocardia cyriacigeorgica TaxID=135487 RepID=UPI001896100F|nr:hypothetical protein [Nocardia cyriacigeorgica]MBF6085138.1 hypothetical protein [Nocardia cyriacigeorgica]
MTKPFQLHRHMDGAGVVADGAQFPDGTVVIRWRGEHASTVVWDTLADALAVHAHGGATRIIWGQDWHTEEIADELVNHLRSVLAEATPGEWVADEGFVQVEHDGCTCGAQRYHLVDCGLTIVHRPESSRPSRRELADAELMAMARRHCESMLRSAEAALELVDGGQPPVDIDHPEAA